MLVSNPKDVIINNNSTLTEIFDRSSSIVLIDDPIEIATLLEYGLTDKEKQKLGSTLQNFYNIEKLLIKKKVIVSNSISTIPSKHGFSIAHSWSGEAYMHLDQSIRKRLSPNTQSATSITKIGRPGFSLKEPSDKQYEYNFHPSFTYLSKDLLTVQSDDLGPQCVANSLAKGSIHHKIMEKTFYLSPSLTISKATDSNTYLIMYKKFMEGINQFKWKATINKEQYSKFNSSWQQIRINLTTNH